MKNTKKNYNQLIGKYVSCCELLVLLAHCTHTLCPREGHDMHGRCEGRWWRPVRFVGLNRTTPSNPSSRSSSQAFRSTTPGHIPSTVPTRFPTGFATMFPTAFPTMFFIHPVPDPFRDPALLCSAMKLWSPVPSRQPNGLPLSRLIQVPQ